MKTGIFGLQYQPSLNPKLNVDEVMNTQDKKAFALKYCIDIYNDYTEAEVKKFTPPCVQKAWALGAKCVKEQQHITAERARRLKL